LYSTFTGRNGEVKKKEREGAAKPAGRKRGQNKDGNDHAHARRLSGREHAASEVSLEGRSSQPKGEMEVQPAQEKVRIWSK